MPGALRDIDIRSEEVQEIVSQIPGWLSRWGITFLFVLFLIFLLMSWFIKYPDTVKASVIITTSPSPFTLSARTSGNITLLIDDNSLVKKGEIIAFIGSNPTPEEVHQLQNFASSQSRDAYHLPNESNFGELQPYYTGLLNATVELDNFLALDIYDKQIEQLAAQQQSYLALKQSLIRQLALARKELQLAHAKFKRDSILYIQKVLSGQDYDAAEGLFVQQNRNYKNAESSIINNEIQINQIRKQSTDLLLQKMERNTVLNQNLQNARRELLARILKWKETYLFVSPIDGKVAYLEFVNTNTFIEQGKPQFAVIPETKEIFAQAKIPITGSGKVKQGQQVNIRLENYPSEQFGMLRGQIVEISALPSDKNYLAKIQMPENLVTTYNKTLPFTQQLQGETEIITEDLRMIERVFYHIRSLVTDPQ